MANTKKGFSGIILSSVVYACALLFMSCAVQHNVPATPVVRVTQYKYNRQCAISYTFDDGLSEHYTLVAPQLDRYGFKGTFWVNGSRINQAGTVTADSTRMDWQAVRELSLNGNEVSNHGWAHKNLTKCTPEEMRIEIFKNDSAIAANTGILPRTYCYPGNRTSPEVIAYVSQNRVGTRTQQLAIGSKSTIESLNAWADTLIKTKGWGVGMTHGISYGYDAFKDPSVLWRHWDYVKTREHFIWVATFREVAAYKKEFDSLQIEVKTNARTITVTPSLNLDKTVFTEPLTAIVEQIEEKNLIVTQDKSILKTQKVTGGVLFEFNPYGGKITIKLEDQ